MHTFTPHFPNHIQCDHLDIVPDSYIFEPPYFQMNQWSQHQLSVPLCNVSYRRKCVLRRTKQFTNTNQQ